MQRLFNQELQFIPAINFSSKTKVSVAIKMTSLYLVHSYAYTMQNLWYACTASSNQVLSQRFFVSNMWATNNVHFIPKSKST